MGEYFVPRPQWFLNLSGGTVSGDTLFTNNLSAATFYGDGSQLSGIFSTRVQPGTNIFTAGTGNFPTINLTAATIDNLSVSGDTSLGSVSATTIYSGGTDLYEYITGGYERVNRVVYVETTGDDVSGDGKSVETAFATIGRALDDIKNNILNCTVDIQLGPGNFDFTSDDNVKFCKFFLKNATDSTTGLTLQGSYNIIKTGITYTADSTNPFKKNKTSEPGVDWTTNAYKKMFLSNSTYTAFIPIYKNDATSFHVASTTAGSSTYSVIVELTTNLNLENNNQILDINTSENTNSVGAALLFRKLIINRHPDSTGQLVIRQEIPSYAIQYCILNITRQSTVNFTTRWSSCYFSFLHSGTTRNYLTPNYDIGNVYENTNPTPASYLAQGYDSDMSVSNNIYAGWTSLFYRDTRTPVLVNFQSIYLDNCTSFYTTGAIPPSTKIYQADGQNLVFENVSYFLNTATYTKDCDISIKNLTQVTPITRWASTPSTFNKWIVPGDNTYIRVPGVYAEIDPSSAVTLTNNATTTFQVGDITQNRKVTIEYSIVRGSNYQSGVIEITHNGTTPYILENHQETSNLGISFDTTIVGNTLNLASTLTNTGSNATMTTNIKRIMI